MSTRLAIISRTLGFAVVLGTVGFAVVSALAPRIARAQDAGTCSPACQLGEICVGSTCMVPACRPPCGVGETCVGGTCMVPAARPPAEAAPPPAAAPPPPVTPPPAPVVRPVARAAPPSLLPTVRTGAYGIAQVGASTFLEDEARYVTPGLRVAGLAGGYFTNNVSLGGGVTFDLVNFDPPPGSHASGFMLEAVFAPLFHAGDARAEFIVGPALGAWLRSIDRSDDLGGKSASSGQGWALGANVGVLAPVRRNVRLGAIFNFMFRDLLHTCATINNGPSKCVSTGSAHDVVALSIAAML